MNASFPKAEHLCSRRLIDRLYADGHRLLAFPYSIQWMAAPSLEVPCQVMIVAPKRKFRHAVDRNRVKRLTRECYRLRKERLYGMLEKHDLHIALSLVYIHDSIFSCDQLGHKMDKVMAALEQDILHTLGTNEQ